MENVILDYIEQIEDAEEDAILAVQESMLINVRKELLMIQYQLNNDNLIVQESAQALTARKNIFVRIIEAIKKFLAFIGQKVRQFFNKIKKLFSRNGASATPDQIIDEMGVQGSKDEVGSKENISIDFDESSKVVLKDIDVMAKAIQFKIDKGDVKFKLGPTLLYSATRVMGIDFNRVKGPSNNVFIQAFVVFVLIKKPEIFDQSVEYFNELIDAINTKNSESVDNSPISQQTQDFNTTMLMQCAEELGNVMHESVSMKELQSFNEKIDNLRKRFDDFKIDDDASTGLSNTAIAKIQEVSQWFDMITMGISAITNQSGKLWIVDKSYHKTIKDTQGLAEFIKRCVESKIPSKYVAYNAWIVASEDIRGDKNYKPRMGQTRFVFLPKSNKDVVYKVAINGSGLSSNQVELNISQKIQKMGMSQWIAKTIDSKCNGYLISCERVKPLSKIEQNSPKLTDFVNRFEMNVNSNLKQKYHLKIMDLHPGNIGKHSNGDMCVIDYGLSYKE